MNIDLADTKYKKPVESKPKKSRDLLTTILVWDLLVFWRGWDFCFTRKCRWKKDMRGLKTSD